MAQECLIKGVNEGTPPPPPPLPSPHLRLPPSFTATADAGLFLARPPAACLAENFSPFNFCTNLKTSNTPPLPPPPPPPPPPAAASAAAPLHF
ncbi:hypothetical protein E2C01_100605 [Portunus trituberculatus]|uniref:Uncharacterized protein n=1 Tax=Portunus trituberculatus TaxID=210409 RepID=A0A5B7KDP9_PORTR|nr:hypothetical protein [Portunus trituberculatus]